MARQLCCRGMCKNLLRSDGQQQKYSKAKFPSNLNCGQQIVSETGPWTERGKERDWYEDRRSDREEGNEVMCLKLKVCCIKLYLYHMHDDVQFWGEQPYATKETEWHKSHINYIYLNKNKYTFWDNYININGNGIFKDSCMYASIRRRRRWRRRWWRWPCRTPWTWSRVRCGPHRYRLVWEGWLLRHGRSTAKIQLSQRQNWSQYNPSFNSMLVTQALHEENSRNHCLKRRSGAPFTNID